MSHIVLIGLSELKSPDNKIWKFPYAFPIIIRQLEQTRHTWEVLDTHLHKLTFDALCERVVATGARIFGISAYSHNYGMVKQLARIIREANPTATIIVGGLLASNDNVLMEKTDVDIAVKTAEGEFVLPELLDALEEGYDTDRLQQVKSITYKDRSTHEYFRTPERKLMSNEQFRQTPLPSYEYFDKELQEISKNLATLENVPVQGFPVLVQRGCPFECTFCGHLYGRKFLRKNWDAFFDELEFLSKRYGFTGFYSLDTNMFLNRKEVDEYSRHYEQRGSTFKINIELRTTFGDVNMFRQLYEHGVRVVLFGLESGSQLMLNNMRKVGFELEKMKSIIKSAADAGLMFHGNFIFGTPGECKQTVRETFDFMYWLEALTHKQKAEMKQEGVLCTSGYGWTILVPSPTSILYTKAVEAGQIEDEEGYLLSLSSEEGFKLVKGSRFKIALAHIGGTVNMSEFPSKKAMLAYIHYSFAKLRLRTRLWQSEQWASRIKDLCCSLTELVQHNFAYWLAELESCLTRCARSPICAPKAHD